jgi:hypothetical protein
LARAEQYVLDAVPHLLRLKSLFAHHRLSSNTTVKGCRRTDLVDVWRRYLPVEADDSGTSVTSTMTGDDMAPHVPNVADVSETRGEGGDLDDNPFGDSF